MLDKYPELHNIYNQVSINARCSVRHRSGDIEGEGMEKLDFYAFSPSPEDELILRESWQDKYNAPKRALKIVSKFFNKTFNATELDFIKAILNSDETPAKIAQALGTDYGSLSDEIYNKFKAISSELVESFYSCGFYCQRAIDFLPRLSAYIKHNKHNERWRAENKERYYANKREWYLRTRKPLLSEEEKIAKRNARREERISKLSPEEQEKARKRYELQDKYYEANKERLRAASYRNYLKGTAGRRKKANIEA